MAEASFEERRKALVAAATRVFARKGFAATNKEIAAEAGVTAAALYWYFPSKDDLIRAVIDQNWPDPAMIRSALLDTGDVPPRTVLTNLATMIASILTAPDLLPLVKVVVQEAFRHAEVSRIYEQRMITPVTLALEEYFARLMDQGIFRRRDPRMLVQCFIGPVFLSALMKLILDHERLRALALGDMFTTAVDVFLDGALAPSPGEEVHQHG